MHNFIKNYRDTIEEMLDMIDHDHYSTKKLDELYSKLNDIENNIMRLVDIEDAIKNVIKNSDPFDPDDAFQIALDKLKELLINGL